MYIAGAIAAVMGLSKFSQKYYYQYVPDAKPLTAITSTTAKGPLQVISFNLHIKNTETFSIVEYLKNSLEPDMPHIIFTPEVTTTAAEELEVLKEFLPHSLVLPSDSIDGMAFFTDLEPIELKEVKMDFLDSRAIVGVFNFNGEEILVIAVHPPAPLSERQFLARNEYFKNIRAIMSQGKRPTLVIGDFNSTPWSDHFKNLLKPKLGGGSLPELIDPGEKFARPFTWFSPIPRLGLPIDFILHSLEFKVLRYEIGPRLGSDHRPVIAFF